MASYCKHCTAAYIGAGPCPLCRSTRWVVDYATRKPVEDPRAAEHHFPFEEWDDNKLERRYGDY